MNRRHILILIAIAFGAASIAKAQDYSGSVLYSLAAPNGVASLEVTSTSPGETTGTGTVGGELHGFLWSAAGAVDLTPTNLAGFTSSQVVGVGGGQQVGAGSGPGAVSSAFDALVWNGTANSAVDLSPNLSGLFASFAFATDGTQQVGEGKYLVGSNPHTKVEHDGALLWSGTAANVVDLTPTNLSQIVNSYADGVAGNEQVGYGNGQGIVDDALLWTGTGASAVNLNPFSLGITTSYAYGTNGTQQVGEGIGSGTGNKEHALLWDGTADSAVDLNPTDLPGITTSSAVAANGIIQVGSGENGSSGEALVWSGSADSAVDLQATLPSGGTWSSSLAGAIDSEGNIYGIATGTYNGITGNFAVEWSPIPEPASLAMYSVACVSLLIRRRRARTPFRENRPVN